MDTTGTSSRYTGVAIGLHWAIALAIGAMIALGWNQHDVDGRPIKWMFQLHKSLGITILLLTIVRVVWRLMNPPPPLPDEMPKMEKMGSHLVHVGFYALMIVMPLTGWLLVSVSPFAIATVLYGAIGWPHLPILPGLALETREAIYPIIDFVHAKLAWVMIGLFALHILGALKHEFGDEEGVLKRMVPGLLNEAAPPKQPSRGALTAFGSAGLFFVIIAGSPVVAQGFSSSPAPTAALGAGSGNWLVDYDTSEIRFSGTYSG
ncbi:MAG: cytochrome b, partial [Pseudomonadota bacterium]